MAVQTLNGTVTDEQLKTLKGVIEEINLSVSKIESENEHIKDIIDAAYDALKVPKKIIKRLAKAHHKQSLETETAEFNEFVLLFEAVNEVG